MSVSAPLSGLLKGLAEVSMDCEVQGIQCRSSAVESGELFAAMQGLQQHGLDGLEEALERGAAAVIYEPDSRQAQPDAEVPCVAVSELSRHLSEIAGRFYRHPSQSLPTIGITGTDGKTSTSHLIAQILNSLQRPCGVIGTLGAGPLEALCSTGHTTPDAVRLQAELFKMVQRGDTAAILEVSSHALAQYRCDAVRFETAVFTTLGHDHLDYHRTQEDYAAAKRRLFVELQPKRAILNVDDAYGRQLAQELESKTEVHTCALQEVADVTAREVRLQPQGLEFEWVLKDRQYSVAVPGLYGRFNVINLLLSASAAQAHGASPEDIAQAMSALRPVPGRLECVARQPWVFIDYAHTPQALEAALRALSEHFEAPLHCVFGCGGDRDRAKRPRMGTVAEQWASHVTLTSDNPRGEAPQQILDEIAAGMSAPSSVSIQPDRAQAIRQAVQKAGSDEVVLIAGKGHETVQEIQGIRHPFSDHAHVHEVLEARA